MLIRKQEKWRKGNGRMWVCSHKTILHLSQWMQKCPKQFPHHGCSGRGGFSQGLMASHICNVLNQKPKDGGGLIQFATKKKKHLRTDESMGW
jgi:hypothetical protein